MEHKLKILLKRTIPAIIAVFIFMSLTSCSAPTYISSWRDPDFNGKISKVMVVALVKDFDYRKSYEYNIAALIERAGLGVEASLDIFGVEKIPDANALVSELEKGKFDALLVVKYAGSKSYTTYTPYFYDWYGYGYNSIYSPGYYERHRSVKTEALLFAENSEKAVWFGKMQTINAYNMSELAKSLAEKIMEDLKYNQLIYGK